MSESIRDSWVNPEAPLIEHHAKLLEGISVIKERLEIPEDGRYEIVYANLVAGGADRSALLLADAGTGKTSFADALIGEDRRTDVRKKMSAGDLFGSQNPINTSEWTRPELVGLQDPNDPVIYLNELPQLPDTGDIHHIWDSNYLKIGGKLVDIRRAVVVGTGNFPDGNRNNILDSAMLRRWGTIMLVGDHPLEKAGRIQEKAAKMRGNTDKLPVMPSADVRKAIGEQLDARFVPMEREFGNYLISLVQNLRKTGLVAPISHNDMRLGIGMQRVATAYMFLHEVEKNQIKPDHLRKVAALAMPSVVTLSKTGKERLSEASEKSADRRATSFEQAIALRRVIARSAVKAYLGIENGTVTPKQ